MNTDRKLLLKKKLEENKRKLKKSQVESKMHEIVESFDNFDSTYRFANDFETGKLKRFMECLEFSSPAHIVLDECNITQHDNMFLCFLCGSEELFDIYVYGDYNKLLLDIDTWCYFSPYLLLVDEDFVRYIFINDNGEIKETNTSMTYFGLSPFRQS